MCLIINIYLIACVSTVITGVVISTTFDPTMPLVISRFLSFLVKFVRNQTTKWFDVRSCRHVSLSSRIDPRLQLRERERERGERSDSG